MTQRNNHKAVTGRPAAGFTLIEPIDKLRARSAARSGFTLIELLVVVTIIAVLAALLLPSLKRAKDRAKLATCTNNLKQLSYAFAMYLQDNDGWMPDSMWFRPENHSSNPTKSRLIPFYIKPKHTAITPWVMQCPSISYVDANSPPYWGGTYGYNPYWYQDHWGNEYRRRLESIKDAATKVVICDAVGFTIYGNAYYMGDWWQPRHDSKAYGSGGYTQMDGRRANVAFGDGHVEFLIYPWDKRAIVEIRPP